MTEVERRERWPVVLVGLPGAGKTTVGRLLAGLLGVPFVDLDDEIEREAGASVRSIFAERGEARFRSLERAASARMRGRRVVLAPGGGWVDDPGNPAALAPAAFVVHLRVAPSTALARIGPDRTSRPLLAGADPDAAMSALAVRRAAAYARSDAEVDTEGVDPERVAELVRRLR